MSYGRNPSEQQLSPHFDSGSIVIEGKFTSYKPAGHTMGSPGKFGWEINVYRMSDHTMVTTNTKGTETMPGWKEDQLEKGTAFYAAYDIKKDLK